MPVVHLKGLTRSFGAFKAVDNIDLEIRDGEFVSLLGPSGCGKTTTLRMIAGFIDPSAGTIDVDGRVLSSVSGSLPPEKRGMSMIFQSYAIWPNMTVAQNVGFGLEIRKVPGDQAKKRIADVLDVVQMGYLAGRYPAELSGGQQQRVALARAIVVNPAVLLLDEPLSNLDANLREEMRSEIRRLHEALKITTVYVTHDQAEAMATSDRIAVMNARRHGDGVHFDGFALHNEWFTDGLPAGPEITFSLRPQSLKLERTGATTNGRMPLAGKVTQRVFLGEHWDYTFQPENSGLQLKVAAAPSDVFEVGSPAVLALDPALLVAIE